MMIFALNTIEYSRQNSDCKADLKSSEGFSIDFVAPADHHLESNHKQQEVEPAGDPLDPRDEFSV